MNFYILFIFSKKNNYLKIKIKILFIRGLKLILNSFNFD